MTRSERTFCVEEQSRFPVSVIGPLDTPTFGRTKFITAVALSLEGSKVTEYDEPEITFPI